MSLTCPTCRTSYPDGTVQCPVDTSALFPEEAFATADLTLESGTMIGEYRVEKKLGEGSFGAVYAGIQPLIGKKVAIKLLHKRMSSEPEIVSRFIDEARAVNKIGHRNIIDVFSFGVYNGTQHYFVMEFCDGMTLGELLHQKKRLTPAEALPILRGIADGLDAAHQANVTHRDLKPDNVFLVRIKDNQYFPKLLDFGVAKLAKEDTAQQTATGVAIGTPRYMSPEQCRGKKVDYRTDIYALGCVAHELLTGKPVFDADTTVDLLFKHMSEEPPSMSSVCPNVPPELDAPVLEMLAKRPLNRPNSAGLAINALADAIRASRASKSSIPPSHGAGVTSTVRGPVTDSASAFGETMRAMSPEPERTIPNEPLLASSSDLDRGGDSVPATRKSLTDIDVAQAQTMPIPPDSGNAETPSGPMIQSQMPATLASTPLPAGAVVDRLPEVKVVGPSELANSQMGKATLVSPEGLSRNKGLVVSAGILVLLGVGALLMRRPQDDNGEVTPEVMTSSPLPQIVSAEPSTITLRASVMPADARILVDGRDLGGAGENIVLPREKKERAVRIERKGYESQTMWVTVDSDKQLGPITLVAVTVNAAASASASAKVPVTAPAVKTAPTTKKPSSTDLLRPTQTKVKK